MNRVQILISFALACLSVAAAPSAHAQSIDISSGKKRAEVCMSCHGADGVSTASPGIPFLAGQDRDYLIKAMKAYRIGASRTDETMTAMAKPLSDADIVNIAAFFNSLPPRSR
jgi:cytochrome c553